MDKSIKNAKTTTQIMDKSIKNAKHTIRNNEEQVKTNHIRNQQLHLYRGERSNKRTTTEEEAER